MNRKRIMQVLVAPHISEKASLMADKHHQITFKVLLNATKLEIQRAVEHLFKVKVDKVNLCRVKGKQKRHKQTLGRRKHWKKAYVLLAKGYDINFASIER